MRSSRPERRMRAFSLGSRRRSRKRWRWPVPTVAPSPRYSLVFNRMSPSAWLRGKGDAIFYTLQYLAHLKRRGVKVVNGYEAFVTETSKALQLTLLDSLGLPYPRARVIHRPEEAPE